MTLSSLCFVCFVFLSPPPPPPPKMMATLQQGVAHRVSKELGTLEVLRMSSNDMITYELSHTTFFPNLVFQAMVEHYIGGKGSLD